MIRPLAAAAAALALAACGGLDEVDITRTASGTVPGAPGAAPFTGTAFGALDLAVDRRTLQENGVDPDDVDSAKLTALRLEVTGNGASFETWLDQVAFYVEAPGQARTLVAQKSGIRALPPGTRVIDLDAAGVDLKPYVIASSGTVTAEASGNQPAETTTIQATATVRVNVSVSGLLR